MRKKRLNLQGGTDNVPDWTRGPNNRTALPPGLARLQQLQQGRYKPGSSAPASDSQGQPSTDTVPAMLTPGEGVLNTGAAQLVGRDNIDQLNQAGQALSGAPGSIPNPQAQTPIPAAKPYFPPYTSTNYTPYQTGGVVGALPPGLPALPTGLARNFATPTGWAHAPWYQSPLHLPSPATQPSRSLQSMLPAPTGTGSGAPLTHALDASTGLMQPFTASPLPSPQFQIPIPPGVGTGGTPLAPTPIPNPQFGVPIPTAKPYLPPYTSGRYTPYQSGTSYVSSRGPIGYVDPRDQDPAWTQVALSAPGINLAGLKEAAKRSGVSPAQVAGLIQAVINRRGAQNDVSSLVSSGYGFGGSQQIPISNAGVPSTGYQHGGIAGLPPRIGGFIPFAHRGMLRSTGGKRLGSRSLFGGIPGYQRGTSDVGDAVYRTEKPDYSGAPRIKTKEEYDKVPVGGVFIDAGDGETYRKEKGGTVPLSYNL